MERHGILNKQTILFKHFHKSSTPRFALLFKLPSPRSLQDNRGGTSNMLKYKYYSKYVTGVLLASAAFKTIYYRSISTRKRNFGSSYKQIKSLQCGIRARILPWQQIYPIADPSGAAVQPSPQTPSAAVLHPWELCQERV